MKKQVAKLTETQRKIQKIKGLLTVYENMDRRIEGLKSAREEGRRYLGMSSATVEFIGDDLEKLFNSQSKKASQMLETLDI